MPTPDPVTIAGPIAFLGRRTVDSRKLLGLTIPERDVWIHAPGFPSVVGQLGRVTFQADGSVQIVASVRSGLWNEIAVDDACPCGIDLHSVRCEVAQDGVQGMAGALAGIMLYPPDSGAQPAWPDTILRRVT